MCKTQTLTSTWHCYWRSRKSSRKGWMLWMWCNPQESMGSSSMLSLCGPSMMSAYGLLSRHVTKGYKRCLACGPNTSARHSRDLGKVVYCAHCRWLRLNHPYWSSKHDFNGNVEQRLALLVMLGFEHLANAELFESWKSIDSRDGDPIVKIGVKRKNILFELPY